MEDNVAMEGMREILKFDDVVVSAMLKTYY
jgi:hypothetical protein